MGDQIAFIKISGEAHEAGMWMRFAEEDNLTGP